MNKKLAMALRFVGAVNIGLGAAKLFVTPQDDTATIVHSFLIIATGVAAWWTADTITKR